jgi:uncharacterized protein YggE
MWLSMLQLRLYVQLLFGLWVTIGSALAADTGPNVIVMTGTGLVSAMPDQAMVTAGAVTQAITANAAVTQNAEIMNRAIAKLKQLGASDKSIIINGFSLDPQYPVEDPKHPKPRVIIGYEVSNSLSVKLDDVSSAGAMLDALLDAGVNRGVNVSFSIKNEAPLLDEARAMAAKDALKRAQIYTSAVGTTLGNVLSIQEGYPNYSRPFRGDVQNVPISITAMSQEQLTPVQASEQSVSATVTITWALK